MEARLVDPEACKRAKSKLWAAVAPTSRGLNAGPLARAEVEEAQVTVEGFERDELDVHALAGNWRLTYTTAPDVVSVLKLQKTGAVQVADICQEFTADGSVTNVINLSVPWVLQPAAAGGGLTLRVEASYEVKGPRTLALAFNTARVGELRISDLVQGLLAPAVLPRTPLQHELLMRLHDAALVVPLRGGGVQLPPALSGGMAYQLTYLDEDTLIGRASGSGGSFIFERVPAL